MKRFCPKCGVTIQEGTFCNKCTTKEIKYEAPLVQISEYNRTWHKGKWHPFPDVEELIRSRIKEELKHKGEIEIEIEPFEFECKKKEKQEVFCTVKLGQDTFKVSVILAYRQCDVGEKTKTQYFEGILQLRNIKDNFYSYVKKEMEKVSKKGIFITNVEDVGDNGVDLYVTNKNYVKQLAQNLHTNYGAKIKINSQLFSFNHLTSKDVFRINALVEFPKFNEGSVISFIYDSSKKRKPEENFMLVKKLGKMVSGRELLTGKSVSYETKYITNETIHEELETGVISTNPDIEVIHPKTFQAEKIIHSLAKDVEVDDRVLVVLTKLGTFIVGYPFQPCDDEE
jgi:NMD protein affecting ribosome stability and mRNA decay